MSDRLLLNPTEKELLAAIRATVRTLNRSHADGRKLERTPVGWQRWVQPCLRDPVGRQSMAKTGSYAGRQLMLAWWSDPFGRKHVRVSGRTSYRYRPDFPRTEAALNRMPPLWHVYPDAFLSYRRIDTKKPLLLVACRCGAVGGPQALVWSGDCCGPCYDRQQENGTPASGFGAVRGLQHRPAVLVFTPDGTALLAGDQDACPSLTDLRTGNRQSVKAPHYQAYLQTAAFTADGTAAVLGCLGGRVLHWRLSESKAAIISEKSCPNGSILSPDGLRLARVYGNRVQLYDLTATPTTSRSYACDAPAIGGRFTPDGRLLVFHVDATVWEYTQGARTGELVRDGCLRGWRNVKSEFRGVGFAADGSAVAVSERSETPGRSIRVVPLPDGPPTDFPIPKWHDPQLLAFSPCKSVLATGGPDGWLGLWDLPAGQNPVWVQPVPEKPGASVSALAFSPSGDTLAVGFGQTYYATDQPAPSVHLLPWRALLGRPKVEL